LSFPTSQLKEGVPCEKYFRIMQTVVYSDALVGSAVVVSSVVAGFSDLADSSSSAVVSRASFSFCAAMKASLNWLASNWRWLAIHSLRILFWSSQIHILSLLANLIARV